MDISGLKDAGKTAIMGVGNPGLGDDRVGVYIAEKLIKEYPENVFNCLSVPENYLGKVNSIEPDNVLIVDAVNLNKEPGFFQIIDADKVHQGISTHNAGLDMIADFFKMSGGKKVYLLAIQPKTLKGEMTPEITEIADKIVNKLKDILS